MLYRGERKRRVLLIVCAAAFFQLSAPGIQALEHSWIDMLNREKPDIVVVGNSMAYFGIDSEVLSQASGHKAKKLVNDFGLMSAWQYMVLKNVIGTAKHKPKLVVLVTRANNITSPLRRCGHERASRKGRIDQLRDGEEELLDKLAYPSKAATKFREDNWNFNQALKMSFLPQMVSIAKKNGVHLVVARHKRKGFVEQPKTYEGSKEQKKYIKDLAAYLKKNDCTFFDYSYQPEIAAQHYSNGDHYNPEGAKIWSDMMGKQLKELAARLNQEISQPPVVSSKKEKADKKAKDGASSPSEGE